MRDHVVSSVAWEQTYGSADTNTCFAALIHLLAVVRAGTGGVNTCVRDGHEVVGECLDIGDGGGAGRGFADESDRAGSREGESKEKGEKSDGVHVLHDYDC